MFPAGELRAVAMAARLASKEVADKVDRPLKPWPMVQPRASTPPTPIKVPPAMERSMWRGDSKPSSFQRRRSRALSKEPATTPTTIMMVKRGLMPVEIMAY